MPQRASRRDLLADTAIEVLAREGGRGLTHRAIDRDADVPEGTTKNYFPSRASLFLAVARRMSDQHECAVRQLREQTPEGISDVDVAALYAAMLRRAGRSGKAQFLALFELHLEGVRRPEVRSALGEMARANAESARYVHAAAGVELSREGASLLDASVMGVAMSMLSLPEEVAGELGFDDPDSLSPALLGMARRVAVATDGANGGAGPAEVVVPCAETEGERVVCDV